MVEKQRQKQLEQEENDATQQMDRQAAFLSNPQNQGSEALILAAQQRGKSLLKAATAKRQAEHLKLDETS